MFFVMLRVRECGVPQLLALLLSAHLQMEELRVKGRSISLMITEDVGDFSLVGS